ncbi:tyrosine-type recombinase/integrase [uncultured Desulfobulbus sp.]|uniref:tyrosine-type recombinase/integrase n=1 Tax=uncultured Desulfobulbus sp. TaxID=239745 RepID=UPI0029C6EE2E|nr:tyrosine-type recombinase/integrase [uncultured Desulfobulbus sp.]
MPKKEIRRFQFTSKNIKSLPIHDRNSPSTDQEYTDSEVVGLKVFVSKTGRKSFHLRYIFNGRKRVIKIADFDCLPLPEVRSIARNYRGMISKGLDPLEERLKRKSAPTFRNFVEEHYLKWAKAHKKSWKDDDRMLKLDWLPEFGNVQLSAVTRRGVQENIMKIQKRSSGATSNRHLSLMSKIFSLAIELEAYEGENPCSRIKKFQESTGRERYLSKEEIKRLLGVLDGFTGNISALLIKFLLFTGLRRGEVVQIRWEDVAPDFQQVRIRMENAKNNKSRFVGLNSLAQAVLQDLQEIRLPGNPYVFPGGVPGMHLTNPNKTFEAVKRKAGLGNFRLHDLRHTFASLSLAGGASLFEVQKMLGHADHKTTQKYAHVSEVAIKTATENTAREIMNALE